MVRYWLVACCLLAGLTGMPCIPGQAEAAGSLADCATIDDDATRLRCYDEAAGRKPGESAAPAAVPPAEAEPRPASPPSYLSRKWQLDPETRKKEDRWSIQLHRANYILPYTNNFHQEKQTYESANPGTVVQDAEAKFQISLKIKLLESILDYFNKEWGPSLGTNVDLWVAYTQLSFWQVYNTAQSSPFRETNYEPELLLNFRTNLDVAGLMRNRFIQVGLNHQSNGRGEPLSRSWNRIVANFGFEREDFDLILKTWYRLPESAEDDDNPDITSYLGYGELCAGYRGKKWERDYHLGLMFRNNLRFDENRSALQLDADFSLIGRLNFYIQYFMGYGESLIDYNHYSNRIGVGFRVKDW
jgi:phospholipase A1